MEYITDSSHHNCQCASPNITDLCTYSNRVILRPFDTTVVVIRVLYAVALVQGLGLQRLGDLARRGIFGSRKSQSTVSMLPRHNNVLVTCNICIFLQV